MATVGAITLAVFSDASATRDSSVSGWAFVIPKKDICVSGTVDGLHNADAEMYAALRGIEKCISVGAQVVMVGTDDNGVQSWVRELRRRANGGVRTSLRYCGTGSQSRKHPEMIQELSGLMAKAEIHVQPVHSVDNEHHLKAHNMARRALPKGKRLPSANAIMHAVAERQKHLNRAAEISEWLRQFGV